MNDEKPSEAALFYTCLAEAFFPNLIKDTIWLLEQAGVTVTIPAGQTCCGQPPYNAGFHSEARGIAAHFLDVFADAPIIVSPSGSCVTMVRHEFPNLFRDDPARLVEAMAIAGRTYELSEFLVNVVGKTDFGAQWHGRATYHDACHMARGLSLTVEPRALLAQVSGLELVEMVEADGTVSEPWCCGFGGAFAVKQSAISGAMLNEKIRRIEAVDVDTVITSDGGCILHMNGGLQRQNKPIRVCHYTEILCSQAK
jgi:L-lactate dehydrogenase complex protein LldE